MQTYPRRKALKVVAAIIAALAVAGVTAGAAQAATNQIGAPVNVMLHLGSHGRRVQALQWLLGNHDPNVFRHTKLKATFHRKPNGLFGTRTGDAVIAYKWQLGYPTRMLKPIAGPYFFELLTGHANRPIRWVSRAAKRATMPSAAEPTAAALKIRRRELSQLGVGEVPVGSNLGPQVVPYERVTGAVGAAWCVSFQQAMFLWSGYGTFANDSASVYYAVDWAQPRGMLRARAKVGALVAFIDYDSYGQRIPGTGHMGYVVRVFAHAFVYVAGNDGNAVREHYIGNSDRSHVFIYIKGVA